MQTTQQAPGVPHVFTPGHSITLRDYRKSVRARHNKFVGPYRWTVPPVSTETAPGRGFYQSSTGLRMDAHGSSLALRLEDANDLLPAGSRLRYVSSYYVAPDFCDEVIAPIVARLPHGRGFLSGWTMGEGMLASLSATVWANAEDAARAAHDDAERQAERETEFIYRQQEEEEAR